MFSSWLSSPLLKLDVFFFFFLLYSRITIYFVNAEGEKTATEAKVNSTLLDVVIDNDLDIAGFG